MFKRGNTILFILVLILIIISIFLLTTEISFTGFTILSQFNNSLTAENLTFVNSIYNYTRYININKNMNISSAYLNLSGFNEYLNQTDRFYILSIGSSQPIGLTTNGSDFWVVDNQDLFVYHLNKTGSNQSDGFYAGGAGISSAPDIVTNNSDFWVFDRADLFIYHFNRTGSNQSDGFYIGGIGFGSEDSLSHLTTNGSDFWVVDTIDDFVYHLNRTGSNQSDGFYVGGAGIGGGTGITTNGSDFWIIDDSDRFIYHLNRTGSNQSDGFYVGGYFGNIYGLTTNVMLTGGTPTDFWFNLYTGAAIPHYSNKYPSNSTLDVGNDSIQEWNHTGDFSLVNNKTADFASAINTYFSSCTADSNGNCSVPFVFHSDSTGKIQYSDLRIDYSDIVDPTASLTPGTDTTVNFGGTVSLSCTGSDNVGLSSTAITVAGEPFCSETSSCSDTYIMSTSGSKTVTCSVTDTSGRSASQSITLSTGGSVGGGGPSSSGGGGTTEPTPVEEVKEIPIITEQPIQQIIQETNIEIPELAYDTINIPSESITSSVSDNSIIVNLGDLASIIYSYVDVSGVKKPKVDILFRQEGLREIKGLVVIKYFDWMRYLIIGLAILILVLMIIYSISQYKVERFK